MLTHVLQWRLVPVLGKTTDPKGDLTVVSYSFEALNTILASTVAVIDAFIKL